MSADTLNNEALISQMLRDAEKANLTSELEKNPIIHKGDENLAAPMTLNKMSSSGYVWVYDTRTGEKIPVIYYTLPQKLRQRRPDGSYRFTVSDPKIVEKKGTVKCMLHKDHENRAHYDELGFRVCPKENITNPYQLRQHMLKKHPQEWAAIEQERTERERAEDRALQRLLLANTANRVSPEEEEQKSTKKK